MGRGRDDFGYGGWAPYVRVADRRRAAAKEVARLKKGGHAASPVVVVGRSIAQTAWGKAWCDNLEAYSDFSNRLPRGRTYVRNGSVIDLGVEPGKIAALVSGSSIYRVTVTITPLADAHWKALRTECAGAIDSLVELLAGKLSRGVMERLCRRDTGLFPTPREIRLGCSCPDGARLCKHVAAVLYGVGARLDTQPELLFRLRGVDPSDLLATASGVGLGRGAPTSKRVLDEESLGDVFGVEMDEAPVKTPRKAAKASKLPPVHETITSDGLLALGIPRSTFQNWITAGHLARTTTRGLYAVTQAARERIARARGG